MAYRGPYTEVIENFELSPNPSFPEDLAAAVIGPVFDVYSKQALVPAFSGMRDTVIPFVVADSVYDKVMYSRSQNQRVYDRYPVRAFLNSDGSEELDLTGNLDADGITLQFGTDANGSDTDMITMSSATPSRSWMPFYSSDTTTFTYESSSKIVTLGDATAQLGAVNGVVVGLPVFERVGSGPYTCNLIGTVEQVLTGTTFVLNVMATPTTLNTGIYIGASKIANSPSSKYLSYLYDADADFSDVRIGDVLAITASGFTFNVASVREIVSSKLLCLHVGTTSQITTTGDDVAPQYIDQLFSIGTTTNTSKANVSAYSIMRLAGFTTRLDNSSDRYIVSNSGPDVVLSAAFADLKINDTVRVNNTDTSVIDTFIVTGKTDDTHFTLSGTPAVSAGDKGKENEIYAWSTSNFYGQNISNTVFADYRVAKTSGIGQIASINGDAGGVAGLGKIGPWNDLAMSVYIVNGIAPSRNFYFTPIDPTLTPATAYAAALALFELKDAYYMMLCTDDAAANALLPGHVLEMSDPYEAMERIALQTWNEEDIYLLSSYSGTVAANTGVITCAGANFIADGVSSGDEVILPDETKIVVTAVVSATSLNTTYTETVSVTGTLTFVAGALNMSKRAQRASLLGASAQRRVTSVFPGSFVADYGSFKNLTLPGFYLGASVTGQDMAFEVSQSQTRYDHPIPGFSNIRLGTNTAFRKRMLDVIGGGGVDVLVQGQSPSQNIMSRHDLTTDMSALEFSLRSITKQADKVAKYLRKTADIYLGKYNISDKLIEFLYKPMTSACSALTGVVVSQCTLNSITRDPNISNKLLFNVKVTVFVEGDYFTITLNIASK